MAERDYIDLAQLQARIKESMADAFPGRYWVKAEIASWSPRANGHCYLSLTQSRGGKTIAESRAIIWKWHYPQLVRYFEDATGEKLRPGITVLVKVQVSFSELYGVSLYIEDVDAAFTLGEQALERKRAIDRLTKDGHMEMQKELIIPEIPFRLAVITSKTAAGYQDFRNHLLGNPEGYAFRLDLYEALMQGEQAPEDIASAIAEAGEKGYDAILILRGGGSETDLLCFDNYGLAVAIAECPVPVVTAIGHDKDVHIADMVANQSVKTPTALADLFLDAFRAQDESLDRIGQRIGAGVVRLLNQAELSLKTADNRLRQAIQRRFSAMAQQAEQVRSRICLGLIRMLGTQEKQLQGRAGRISRGLIQKYSEVLQRKDQLAHHIQFAAQARVSQEISAVALKEALVKASDPRNILSLGYVLVTGKDNKVLKTVEKVHVGDRIGVRFSDGSLLAKVDEVYTEQLDNNKVNIA